MIDPNLKQKDVFGIQGNISFSKTNPNTNISLYKEILRFMQGDQGLAGSGGNLANRLRTPQGFQQSNVFNSNTTRQRVQRRLEQQFTEFLNQSVGAQAEAQGMSIPAFLQSQGIRGVRETGKGDNRRLTLYSPDNFIETSQNPITGSTEKMARAFMKGAGAVHSVSGGTNEGRILSAYLRPEQAEHVNDMIRNTAFHVNAGTYHKGDREALYGSDIQRRTFKSKQTALRNDLSSIALESRSPETVEEIKSKLLKQQEEKDAIAQAKQELIKDGLLPDEEKDRRKSLTVEERKSKLLKQQEEKDAIAQAKQELIKDGLLPDEEKDRRKSPADEAAKATSLIIVKIGTTLSKIKTQVGSMIGLLTNISAMVGKIVMDASEVGLDPDVAHRMLKWGQGNPTYTEGNANLLMDGLKSFNAKFGDLTRFDSSANFTSAAFNDYTSLIGLTLDASLKRDPLGGMQKIFGAMAYRYFSISGEENRRKELLKQSNVLSEEYGDSFSQSYRAMLLSGKEQGWLGKHNARRIFQESISNDRVNRLSISGVHLDKPTGAVTGSFGIKHNTKALNSVLGDVNKLKHTFYMMLLSNMDIIIQLLLGISRAALSLMAKFDVPGAEEGLKALKQAERSMARQGYTDLLTNSLKFRTDAEANVTSYLRSKGLKDEELSSARYSILSSIFTGTALPSEHTGFLKTRQGAETVAAMEIYKYTQKKANSYYPDFQEHGSFKGSGNIYKQIQKSGYNILAAFEKYGISNVELDQNFAERVGGRKLSRNRQRQIVEDVSGKSSVFVPAGDRKSKKFFRRFFKIREKTDSYYLRNSESLDGSDLIKKSLIDEQKSLIDVQKNLMYDAYPFKTYPFKKKSKDHSSLQYPELSSSIASSQFSLPTLLSGAVRNDDPFEIINRVELSMNGQTILSNANTLSDTAKKRSYINLIRQNLSTPT